MKVTKNFLCIAITMCMIFGLFPNTAMALDTNYDVVLEGHAYEQVSFTPDGDIGLEIGKSLELQIENLPDNIDSNSIVWDYDEKYITMEGNTITAVSPGITDIALYILNDGTLFQCEYRKIIVYELSGTCGAEGDGQNLEWEIDPIRKTLTIRGEGAMADYISSYDDYGDYSDAPWFPYCRATLGSNIEGQELNVIVEEGVTSIGDYAFDTEFNTINVVHATLPASITHLGKYTGIKNLDRLPESLNSLDEGALYGTLFSCSELAIPENLTMFGDYSLYTELNPGESNFTEAYFRGHAPEFFGKNVFYNTEEFKITYVPEMNGWTNSDAYDEKNNTWNGYKIEPWDLPLHSGKIEGFYPGNNSQISELEQSMIRIKFNKEVLSGQVQHNYADLDFTKNPIKLYRLSDDKLLYQVTEDKQGISFDVTSYSSSSYEVNVSIMNIDQLLDFGESYYVTMGEGFIRFADGTFSPAIKKGEWQFSLIPPQSEGIDRWRFNNSYKSFSINGRKEPNGNYITSNDYERLTSNLSIIEKIWISGFPLMRFNIDDKRIIDNSKKDITVWGGACQGMSSWVCLTSRGIRNASEIDSSKHKLYSIDSPADNNYVASAINYYHHQQRLPRFIQEQKNFKSLNQNAQLVELKSIANEVNTTNKYANVLYTWYNVEEDKLEGHSVVIYGLEKGRWIKTVHGVTDVYKYRALIYDCAYPSNKTFDNYCIYFNDNTWCIPGYNIISTSNTFSEDPKNNGCLDLITDDVDILNLVDFSSGKTSASAKKSVDSNVLLDIDTSKTFELQQNESYCTVENGELVYSSFADPVNIIYDAGVIENGNGNSYRQATLVLPNSDGELTINTKDPITYAVKSDNYYMAVNSDASGSVEFGVDGAVKLNGNSAKSYHLCLAANEGFNTLPWYLIEVFGDDSTDISVKWVEEGIKISGHDLNNIEVNASNDEGSEVLEIETDQHDILIKDVDGSLGAYIDTDGNGVYETPIDNNYNQSFSSSGKKEAKTQYSIFLDKIEHGTVDISQQKATKGTQIIVKINPEKHYKVGSVDVIDEKGNKIQIKNDNGDYIFKMPASDVRIKCIFVKVPIECVFQDISDKDYYYEAILWAMENKITSGTSETTFSPNGDCTRAEAITFLWRAAGSPVSENRSMNFVDVPSDAYYFDAVLWAIENGITSGTSETTFSPNANCTRADVVVFLWRIAGEPIIKESKENFWDVSSNQYYQNAVAWAASEAITSGTSENTFSPLLKCNRAQIITFLWRYFRI